MFKFWCERGISQGYLYTQNARDLFEPILHSEVVADDLVIYYIV